MAGPEKGRADYYAEGDWNVACSMCGFKRKASEMVKNWQGMWRCPEHNEPRHPQDFVKGVPDNPTPPFVQLQLTQFVAICFPNDRSAIPAYAVPGCAIPGFLAPGNTIPHFQA